VLEADLTAGWVELINDPEVFPPNEAAHLRIAFVRHVLPLYEDNMIGRRARTAPRKLLDAFEKLLKSPDNPFRQRDVEQALDRVRVYNLPVDGRLAATTSDGGYDYDTAQHSVVLAAMAAVQDGTETADNCTDAVFLNADLYGDPALGMQALNEALYRDQIRGIQTQLPEGELARRAQLDVDYSRREANLEKEWQADQVRDVYWRITTDRIAKDLLTQLKKNWEDTKKMGAIRSGIERAQASANELAGLANGNTGGFATWPRWLGLGLIAGGTIACLVIAPEVLLAAELGAGMTEAVGVEAVALTVEEAAAQTGLRAVTVRIMTGAVKTGAALQSEDIDTFLEDLIEKLRAKGLEVLVNIPEAIVAR
jgi:hypothetical protein